MDSKLETPSKIIFVASVISKYEKLYALFYVSNYLNGQYPVGSYAGKFQSKNDDKINSPFVPVINDGVIKVLVGEEWTDIKFLSLYSNQTIPICELSDKFKETLQQITNNAKNIITESIEVKSRMVNYSTSQHTCNPVYFTWNYK